MELGTWNVGDTLLALVPITDLNGTPVDPAVAPTFRIYQGTVLMNNGTGSLAPMDTGPVQGATNATPVVITSAGHGLTTGTRVTLTGLAGLTSLNGNSYNATVLDANRFQLDGSAGNGPWTAGGTWHTTGAYSLSKALNGGDGYTAGLNYSVLINYSAAGTAYGLARGFAVV